MAQALLVSAAATIVLRTTKTDQARPRFAISSLVVVSTMLTGSAVLKIAALRNEMIDWGAASLFNRRLVTTITQQFRETQVVDRHPEERDSLRNVCVHGWEEIDSGRRRGYEAKYAELSRLLKARPKLLCLVDQIPGRIGRGIGPQNAFPIMAEASWMSGQPVAVVFRQEPAGGAVPVSEAMNWLVRPLEEPMLVWYQAPYRDDLAP